jgi:hypothetical protein
MTAKQKRMFKIGAQNLMDELVEILELTSSPPQDRVKHTLFIIRHIFKKHRIATSLLTYWETEWRKLGNVDQHLNGTDDRN